MHMFTSAVARQAARRARLGLELLEDRTVPTTYEVGTGLAYQSLGVVPWGQLAPGDTVNVHWRPEGYHELILLSSRGTEQAPIRVVGVAGPDGQKPVIDGAGATMSPTLRYAYEGTVTSPGTPNRGLIV